METPKGLIKVSMWGSDIKKLRQSIMELPESDTKSKLLLFVNKKLKTRPIAEVEKISSLLDELLGLISKCDIPESIEDYMKAHFKEIKNTLQGVSDERRMVGS